MHSVHGSSTAPISPDMQTALQNVGLNLSERLLFSQIRRSEAPSFMILMVGLARGCHSRTYLRELLVSCHKGISAATLVLQFGGGTIKSRHDHFNGSMCRANVVQIAKHTLSKCNIAMIEQTFYTNSKPCGSNKPLPEAVQKQTFAIGRAYDWARSSFPWEAKYYIRVRMDDLGWCVPSRVPIAHDQWVLYNTVYRVKGTERTIYSDRFAIFPSFVAYAYVMAWHIWTNGIECEHPCYASHEYLPTAFRRGGVLDRGGETHAYLLSVRDAPYGFRITNQSGNLIVSYEDAARIAHRYQNRRPCISTGRYSGNTWP